MSASETLIACVARAWTAGDTEQIVRWFAEDPTLWQYIPGIDRPMTDEELRAHTTRRLAEQANNRALVVAIDRDGRLAGQFVLSPRTGSEGACHLLVGRWAKGYGMEICRCGVLEAQRLGVRKIVGIPSPLLPQDVYIRFLKRVGFTIKFYGEITL